MGELKLPKIGFGTWQLKPRDCRRAVLKALEIGYRFIDTAQMYRNEEAVGEAIAESGIPRDGIILATKVSILNLGYGRVKKSTEVSLRRLRTDYVDILYVHWPMVTYNARKTLKAFSELVDEGKVKFIGVSNFPISRMEEAISVCDKPIAVNQVEAHPLCPPVKLKKYLDSKGIALVAYSPLARGRVMNIPEITEVARKHGCSNARVALAWSIQSGMIPIPKAAGADHIEDNFKALELKLDEEDMEKISSIKIRKRLFKIPIIGPKFDD